MPDQPTDKVILKLDDDKLKELFSRGWIQPGSSLKVTSATLVLDEVSDDVAILSIEDISLAPDNAEKADGEMPEVGPGDDAEPSQEESAAVLMMTGKKGED